MLSKKDFNLLQYGLAKDSNGYVLVLLEYYHEVLYQLLPDVWIRKLIDQSEGQCFIEDGSIHVSIPSKIIQQSEHKIY